MKNEIDKNDLRNTRVYVYGAIYSNYIDLAFRPAEKLNFLQLIHLKRNMSLK